MKSGTIYDQLDWWQRQDRGSFDLGLYLEICRIKKNEQTKFKEMKRFKATFKTWAYVGAPMIIETRIVEAYDVQHVKNLIQKNDDIILEIRFHSLSSRAVASAGGGKSLSRCLTTFVNPVNDTLSRLRHT